MILSKQVYLLIVFATVCLVALQQVSAQYIQQGSKLVGTVAVGTTEQGYSVALSADGNTAIVGGPGENSYAGAAWIFLRSGITWNQQYKLVGTGAVGSAWQGSSVSLSADGNTAIIGGPNDSSYAGAAWIFVRSGSTWYQQGTKLVGTGAVGNALQGLSVAISADGNTVIMGGVYDNNNAGAAWVFTRSGSTWSQQGSKLVGTGGVGNAQQGTSVSISADGNTAIVGGAQDNSNAGAAWVFTRSGGVWSQQGSKLVGTGGVGNAQQGTSVSISADGNTAIVGGAQDNSQAGAVWVFTRSGGVWSQQGSKLVGAGAVGSAGQGGAISVSADGDTAIVGGPIDNSGAGAAWVFVRSDGAWSELGTKLVGAGAVGHSAQGYSVSLSGDGTTALVGGVSDNSIVGAAWVWAIPVLVGQVSLVYPAEQALVSATVIPFIWNKPAGNPTEYEFDLATDSLFNFQSIDSTLTDTTKVVSGLPETQTYWWRVRGKNEYGWGPFSEKRFFVLGTTAVYPQSALPANFFLSQNYPNPFNPSTTISYELSTKSFVTLMVYNLLGEQVAMLVNEKENAGSYSVKFDGSRLASGVYFYRLTAGSFVSVKKLVVLK